MKVNINKKVIIGLSGGVDSSVSAFLLKKQGYEVEGLFMKNWEEDDNENYCHAAKDLKDAEIVCDQLKIKLHKVNFSSEYWDNVFKKCLSDYKLGITPNPDILCNKEIKFKLFLKFAMQNLNANFIATGHYVQKKNINKKYFLLKSVDQNKDQSYFLYTLNQKSISKSLFPIGMLKKLQVRAIAAQEKLVTAYKKDSTGICFIGKRNFNHFLSKYLRAEPGDILDIYGNIIGTHQGLIYYTLGQRKGLGIGGIKNSDNNPWYVVEKKICKNQLVVVQNFNNVALMSIGLIAKLINWIDFHLLKKNNFCCSVKTRYRQKDVLCQLTLIKNNRVKVSFNEPIRAVTPGQSAVFYLKNICLGGGIIEKYFS